ncbi:MAG: guanylate kinase [Chloroflexi bacterium]|nr:guanylate kinase [Chloroflexota bacterium]MQC27817.1 guanylate kinase [Chloroflexota bacterium]
MAPPDPSIDRPLVIVLSGPSGAGKDAVMHRMRERGLPIAVPATMTTRAPRDGEVDGVHHVFVDRAEFERTLAEGELLEHAEVYGNYYGVPRSEVRTALARGRHVIVRVDVQGAASLRAVLAGALFLFIVPDDLEHLEAHLRERGTEDEAALQRRLAEARVELEQARHFDHVVTNVEGDLDATVDAAWALIEGEAARPDREPIVV